MHTYIHAYLLTHIHTQSHTLLCRYTDALIHWYIGTLIHTNTDTVIHCYIHTYIHAKTVHTHTHIHPSLRPSVRPSVHWYIDTLTYWNVDKHLADPASYLLTCKPNLRLYTLARILRRHLGRPIATTSRELDLGASAWSGSFRKLRVPLKGSSGVP